MAHNVKRLRTLFTSSTISSAHGITPIPGKDFNGSWDSSFYFEQSTSLQWESFVLSNDYSSKQVYHVSPTGVIDWFFTTISRADTFQRPALHLKRTLNRFYICSP